MISWRFFSLRSGSFSWGHLMQTLTSQIGDPFLRNTSVLSWRQVQKYWVPYAKKSEVLTAVEQQFQQLLRKSDNIKIYCFFEEKAVVGVGMIVSKQSAVLSQYSNQSIAANHMNMTKFSGRNDEGYQKVLNRVHDFMEAMRTPHATDNRARQSPHLLGINGPASSSALVPAHTSSQTMSNTGFVAAMIGNQNVGGGFRCVCDSCSSLF